MTKLFLIFTLLISFNAFSQKPDVSPLEWDNDNLFRQKVYDLPGLEADFVFTTVKKYLINAYKNYEAVVQVEDRDLALFSGRANVGIPYKAFPGGQWNVYFNFKIEIKDEKIRYTYSGFEVADANNQPLEVYTKNALSGNYLKKLQGPAKDVIPGLGDFFIREEEQIRKTLEESDDW